MSTARLIIELSDCICSDELDPDCPAERRAKFRTGRMGYDMNRTYTVYFSEDGDGIKGLKAALHALQDDWDKREAYVGDRANIHVKNAFGLIEIGIDLLTERVAE